MAPHQILLLSSSRAGNVGYLEAVAPLIQKFFGNKPQRIAFVPFAAVGISGEEYAAKVREGLKGLPYTIEPIGGATTKNVLKSCTALMVGGGNTFKLLADLYQKSLVEELRELVMRGLPYIGWSAGANVAGRSICTSNDMPIVQPQSFLGFRFLPFQINPHYLNYKVEGFNGETRDERITEFLTLNPGIPVLALPEGTGIRLQQEELYFEGAVPATLFDTDREGKIVREMIGPGQDITHLL